ncbi:MAG: manganese-binding transcriptional regulator MntR [Phycisphaerae bacterium]|jgi:DtxR family manganese transport transcriptional regulator
MVSAKETPQSSARNMTAVRASQQAFRQTRRDHATETAEDYVELIDRLSDDRGEVRLVDIAKHMGVSPVTVNQTLSRLQRAGLVRKEPYRAVFLTAEGKNLATRSRNRHEVVVRFLCTIGVPDVQAAIDAEGIEHHISAVTLQKMTEFIG